MTFKKVKDSIESRSVAAALGLLVWWSAIKVQVTPGELERLCDKHGLDRKFMPKPLTPQRAFQRAAEQASSKSNGVLVRKVFESSDEITYGIMELTVDEGGREIEGQQVAKVTWNHTTGNTETDKASDAVVKQIVAALPDCAANFKTSDVRNMVARVFDAAGAISMSAGGQFGTSGRFVPISGQPMMDVLFNVVSAIPGACLDMITVPDDDTSRHTIRRATKAQFDTDVEAAEKELDRLGEAVKQANGTGGPKADTIKARIAEFKSVRERVGLFSDTLKFKADDLNKRLAKVEQGLQLLLGI